MSLNVFADIGLPDPELQLAKARIVSILRDAIKEKGLNEQNSAQILSLNETELHNLMRGLWEDYTVERLLGFVNALNRNVHIVIDAEDVASGEEAHTLVLTA